MSEACQNLAFTHPIVVLKSGLKNNWMKKLDRVNRPVHSLETPTLSCCTILDILQQQQQQRKFFLRQLQSILFSTKRLLLWKMNISFSFVFEGTFKVMYFLHTMKVR